jgi:hypothetical protein
MTRRTETPPEDYVPSELAARIMLAATVSLEPMLLRLFPAKTEELMTRAAWAVDKVLTRAGVEQPEEDRAVHASA